VQLSQRRGYRGHYRPRRWAEDAIAEDEAEDDLLAHHSTRTDAEKDNGKGDRKQPAASLFEELFPEEGHHRWTKQKSRKLEKLPTFNWRPASKSYGLGAGEEHIRPSGTRDADALAGLRKDSPFAPAQDVSQISGPAVLLMSSLSKHLDESDFTRLSPKAEHIEGWSNGLVKGMENFLYMRMSC
jgi:hypothetical protein